MTRSNAPLAAVSVGISLLLWVVVYSSNLPPARSVSFTASLAATGLDTSRYVVVNLDPGVRFTALGETMRLGAAREQGVSGIVDLSQAAPGVGSYPVRLVPEWMDNLVVNGPLTVRVNIEPLARRRLPVVSDTTGRLRDDNLALSEARPTPSEITVVGAASIVARVAKAVATLALEDVDPSAPRPASVPVRLLDADGDIVSDGRATSMPPVVELNPVLALAPGEKTVVVSPIFRGTPAPGYVPNGYRMEPEQVVLRGGTGPLAGVSKVFTEPLAVSGTTGDVARAVRMIAPSGTRIVGSPWVRVRYLVKRGP